MNVILFKSEKTYRFLKETNHFIINKMCDETLNIWKMPFFYL